MAAGITIVYNHFPQIIAHLDSGVNGAVQDTANKIADAARAMAPVDTGALRDSIQVQSTGKNHAEVTANIRYAAYVEYGTAEHGGPQPFLTPAAHQAEPQFRAAVADTVKP